MGKTLLSFVGGAIGGLFIFASMGLAVAKWGLWGLLVFPLAGGISLWLVTFIVCLPYYLEERGSMKFLNKEGGKG